MLPRFKEIKINRGQTLFIYSGLSPILLILNTRSSQALIQAGISRSQWNAINRTGNAAFEARLTGQLSRNNLTEIGISTVWELMGSDSI